MEFSNEQTFVKTRNHKTRKTIGKLISFVLFFLLIDLAIVGTFEFSDLGTQGCIVEAYACNDGMFYTDDTCPQETADKINSFYNSLPSCYKEVIRNHKWKYLLCREMPSTLSDSSIVKAKYANIGNIYGLTIRLIKTSYINTNQATYETFVHETGHIIEIESGYISKTKEFEALYNKYSPLLFSNNNDEDDYYASNKNEYFAYLFSEYYLNADNMKNEMPDAYDYFNNILSRQIKDDNLFNKMITRPIYLLRAIKK